MTDQYLHSGEPLPIPPEIEDPELDSYLRKLTEYLRRLTAKLSSDIYQPPVASEGSAVESCAFSLSSLQAIGAAFETIIWDQVIRLDSPFSYDVLTGKLTFLEAGFYLFLVDIGCDDNQWTSKIIDADASELPYGHGEVDVLSAFISTTQAIPVHVHVNQVLEFQVNANANVTADNSRMTVLKLGDFDSGGDTGGDPCDLDVWLLCD